MAPLMYQSSAAVFSHHLKNFSAILKTAAKDAKARGIEPAVLLNARLAPDMFPLVRQVQIATDNAKGCSARLAGVESPVYPDEESTFEELEARIKRVQGFIKGLRPADFEGSESREVELKLPFGTLRFTGADYLNGWALPNFYFHYSCAYAILRHNGLGLGKRDFLGMVPGVQPDARAAKAMGFKPAATKAKKKPKKTAA